MLDLAHWDTQELSKLWLLHSPDTESGRGHREGREEKGKKGLIVQELRVGNFTGCPEQSLEETQALSTAPPTPWVIYGMETMLEKQTLLSLACFAPSADIQPPLPWYCHWTPEDSLAECRMAHSCSQRGSSSLHPTPHSHTQHLWHCHSSCCSFKYLT